jgi:hypothetical protein
VRTSEVVWTQRLEEKSFGSAGDGAQIVQSADTILLSILT